jgi:hypothetical protein
MSENVIARPDCEGIVIPKILALRNAILQLAFALPRAGLSQHNRHKADQLDGWWLRQLLTLERPAVMSPSNFAAEVDCRQLRCLGGA